MSTSAIRRLIRAAGREPVERDTLYNVVTGPEAPDEARRSVTIAVEALGVSGRRRGSARID